MKKNIVLLTDFGDKSYVGQMKGVILSICPNVNILDLAHSVEPQNTREAELLLRTSYKYFPENSIFVTVVDPGVGSKRIAAIVEYDNRVFIGPDNGTFGFINNKNFRAFSIENKDFMLDNISNTFHGRDIFAPAAAHFAVNGNAELFGKPLKSLIQHKNFNDYDIFTGCIIAFDSFGNAITSIDKDMLETFENHFGFKPQKIFINDLTIGIHETFSDVKENEPLAYWGSYGRLEIAVNKRNARQKLGLNLLDKIKTG